MKIYVALRGPAGWYEDWGKGVSAGDGAKYLAECYQRHKLTE